MEEPLRSLMLTLENICLRRVCVVWWSQNDVLDLFDRHADQIDIVENNIKRLGLPTRLLKSIMYIVRPIGVEIREFKKFHEEYLSTTFERDILGQISWTYLVAIDYRKTAENIIRLEMLDNNQLYKLACIYCLDAYIPVLWANLPENQKEYYKSFPFFRESLLPFCWPYILNGEERRIGYGILNPFREETSFYKSTFNFLACTGNKAATEYFFQKLTRYAQRNYLIETTKNALNDFHRRRTNFREGRGSETISYLLFLMSPEQQMEMINWDPSKMLKCLINWPWQDLFVDIVDRTWTTFSEISYVRLLQNISQKMKSSHCVSTLFQNVFLRGSKDFVKHFVNEEYWGGYFLDACFEIDDSETMKLVFSKVRSVDIKRMVTTRSALVNYHRALLKGAEHLVELCLREAVLSREDKEALKDAFPRYLTERWNLRQCDSIVLEKFLRLVDEANPEASSQINRDEANPEVSSQINRDEANPEVSSQMNTDEANLS